MVVMMLAALRTISWLRRGCVPVLLLARAMRPTEEDSQQSAAAAAVRVGLAAVVLVLLPLEFVLDDVRCDRARCAPHDFAHGVVAHLVS